MEPLVALNPIYPSLPGQSSQEPPETLPRGKSPSLAPGQERSIQLPLDRVESDGGSTSLPNLRNKDLGNGNADFEMAPRSQQGDRLPYRDILVLFYHHRCDRTVDRGRQSRIAQLGLRQFDGLLRPPHLGCG